MKIQILATTVSTKANAKGKPFQNVEVAYKNFDNDGKVESKNITSYSSAFKVVSDARAGQAFDVLTQKNDNGYWEWADVKRVSPEDLGATPVTNEASHGSAVAGTRVPVATTRSTYETPEERAKKQVYIVKQSSLSNAINMLSIGAKNPLESNKVMELAQTLTNWVFNDNLGKAKTALIDLPNDNLDADVPF